MPSISRIKTAVRQAFVVDPNLEASRETMAEENAEVWVLNGSGAAGQASRIAAYLEYQGLTASAPAIKPPPTNTDLASRAASSGTRSPTPSIRRRAGGR